MVRTIKPQFDPLEVIRKLSIESQAIIFNGSIHSLKHYLAVSHACRGMHKHMSDNIHHFFKNVMLNIHEARNMMALFPQAESVVTSAARAYVEHLLVMVPKNARLVKARNKLISRQDLGNIHGEIIRFVKRGGLAELISARLSFKGSKDIAKYFCDAISLVANEPDVATGLGRDGILHILCEIMQQYRGGFNIRHHVCGALNTLLQESDNQSLWLDFGGRNPVLSMYRSDATRCPGYQHGFIAGDAIFDPKIDHFDPVNFEVYSKVGAYKVLREVLKFLEFINENEEMYKTANKKHNQKNEDVISGILFTLYQFIGNDIWRRFAKKTQVHGCILDSMRVHRRSYKVHWTACITLLRLCNHGADQEVVQWIDSDPADVQIIQVSSDLVLAGTEFEQEGQMLSDLFI
jgi:hypothetical protein